MQSRLLDRRRLERRSTREGREEEEGYNSRREKELRTTGQGAETSPKDADVARNFSQGPCDLKADALVGSCDDGDPTGRHGEAANASDGPEQGHKQEQGCNKDHGEGLARDVLDFRIPFSCLVQRLLPSSPSCSSLPLTSLTLIFALLSSPPLDTLSALLS
eukprot:766562-Hanusia_phi.AAC.2